MSVCAGKSRWWWGRAVTVFGLGGGCSHPAALAAPHTFRMGKSQEKDARFRPTRVCRISFLNWQPLSPSPLPDSVSWVLAFFALTSCQLCLFIRSFPLVFGFQLSPAPSSFRSSLSVRMFAFLWASLHWFHHIHSFKAFRSPFLISAQQRHLVSAPFAILRQISFLSPPLRLCRSGPNSVPVYWPLCLFPCISSSSLISPFYKQLGNRPLLRILLVVVVVVVMVEVMMAELAVTAVADHFDHQGNQLMVSLCSVNSRRDTTAAVARFVALSRWSFRSASLLGQPSNSLRIRSLPAHTADRQHHRHHYHQQPMKLSLSS